MKKKIICLFLACFCLFSLTSCGKKKISNLSNTTWILYYIENADTLIANNLLSTFVREMTITLYSDSTGILKVESGPLLQNIATALLPNQSIDLSYLESMFQWSVNGSRIKFETLNEVLSLSIKDEFLILRQNKSILAFKYNGEAVY